MLNEAERPSRMKTVGWRKGEETEPASSDPGLEDPGAGHGQEARSTVHTPRGGTGSVRVFAFLFPDTSRLALLETEREERKHPFPAWESSSNDSLLPKDTLLM